MSAASIEAQLKLLELRRTLEPFAVRLAAQRANAQQRRTAAALAEEVLGATTSVDYFATFLRDAHALVVSATHNEFVEVAMAPLQGLSPRFWFGNLTDPHQVPGPGRHIARRDPGRHRGGGRRSGIARTQRLPVGLRLCHSATSKPGLINARPHAP